MGYCALKAAKSLGHEISFICSDIEFLALILCKSNDTVCFNVEIFSFERVLNNGCFIRPLYVRAVAALSGGVSL